LHRAQIISINRELYAARTENLDELEAIVKMVECGLGMSLLPEAGLWFEYGAKVRVISLGELTFYREIVLLQRYSQRPQPIQQFFARCLTQSDF
jgi:DNA-binding transcriptional LysR family regulator